MGLHIKKQLSALSARLEAAIHTLVRRLTPKRLFIIGSGVAVLSSSLYLASFYWPRTISFSYSSDTCFTNPVLLPRLTVKKTGGSYEVVPHKIISLGGYPIYSHATCVTASSAPKEKTIEQAALSLRSNSLLNKSIRIITGTSPALSDHDRLGIPIATKDSLVLKLNRSDRIFTYRLLVGDHKVDCPVRESAVRCDIARLQLAQSTHYVFTLQRLFQGKVVKNIFTRTIRTVEAVQITLSSITQGQTVYDVPTDVTFQLNKPVQALVGAKLYNTSDGQRQEVPVKIVLGDKSITATFAKPLARSASFVLDIQQATAADGGYLPAPYSLSFATSGGPKVVSTNIGKRVQPTGSIILTFDTDVAPGQAIGDYVRLEAGGQVLAASITVQGRKVTVKPAAAMPRCAVFAIKVLDGLQNTFGVSGGSARQFSSRVVCQTVFSIGTSVKGRGITAYSFGNGPSKIIFLGGTHGNEKSSVYSLNQWIEYLENNPDRIPAHRTIIVIPNLNPDGYALGQRTNANNVDLNRNFPTSSWKQGVTMPDKSFNSNGGGAQPLSEPESRALANYVLSQNPRLVLTYHASGGVVVPNDSGDSNALAVTYAQKSSVGYLSGSGTASFFEYDTTGAFEDWMHEKHAMPALLIELITKTNNEFNGHQNALWHIAQLP